MCAQWPQVEPDASVRSGGVSESGRWTWRKRRLRARVELERAARDMAARGGARLGGAALRDGLACLQN
jgi:hypothetical protein